MQAVVETAPLEWTERDNVMKMKIWKYINLPCVNLRIMQINYKKGVIYVCVSVCVHES